MKKISDYIRHPKQFLNLKERRVILSAFVLLLLALVVYLAFYYYNLENKTNNNTSEYKVLADYSAEERTQPDIEQPQVYSRSGKVTGLDDKKITFESTYYLDNKLLLATIKAEITPETKFYKRDLYQVYIAGLDANEKTGIQEISLSEIKNGNEVMVLASDDIKYKTTFPVAAITIIYRSQEF